jgi:REP element-mobilizing transposase RayT
MSDHIHLLVGIHPTISVATFVHDLKIATHNFMVKHKAYFPQFTKWSEGYCALSYSESEKENVMRYIINQKEHHKRISFIDEYRAWLIENGILVDAPYFPK